jgi:hypothetical protein
MANYYGTARSNYFLVKDPEAFTNEMSKYPVHIITKDVDGVTLYGFLDKDPDGGANIWAYYPEDEDGDFGDIEDLEWEEVFKRHLADDWVAVIMECGAEKHRYLGGFAGAYNNKGETKTITLGDIYGLATNLGSNITEAYY